MAGEVLYVLKRFPRLSETFVLRELLALEAMGERVAIDALLMPEPGPHHDGVDRLRAEVRYLPRRPRLRDREVARAHLRVAARRPLRWLRSARSARRDQTWRRFVQAGLTADRARRIGARHVHAHFATGAAEVAAVAADLAGLTASVTAHAKDIFHEDNVGELARRLERATTVVTVSDYNRRHLIERVRPPVVTIPNGVPVPEVAGGPAPDGTVLCVARLVAKKGVDVLLHAAAELRAHHPTLRVEIVGSGPLAEELGALAAALGVGPTVRWLGACTFDEVEVAYHQAAMVVLPCRVDPSGDRDGLPTVLTEAMARGLPVVSTEVVGIPEIVRHGETGLLCPPDDPASLAAAIDKLLSDPELGVALGRSGRALVAREHDPKASVIALRQVFGARS